jgi:hypothetical protein
MRCLKLRGRNVAQRFRQTVVQGLLQRIEHQITEIRRHSL